jgi:hypothetical protein
MTNINNFEEFSMNESKKKKKKAKKSEADTDSFESPEYVVQPAKGETGFFMFKKAFDKMKRRFAPGFFSTTTNNENLPTK